MPSFANDPGGPQFRAPGFLQPKTFEAIDRIPQSFDEMFDRVAKAKALEEQKKTQKKNKENALNMLMMNNPEQAGMIRASQEMDPTQFGQTLQRGQDFFQGMQNPDPMAGGMPEVSPLEFQASQMFQRRQEQKDFSSRKQEAELAKTEAQTEAFSRDQIFIDPVSGKQIVVPKGAKLLPRAAGLSAGEKKVDETFAKDFSSWVSGGFADAQKGIKQIGDAITTLGGDSNLTGPIAGSIPFQAITKPKSKAVQEDVEEVVQRNLRLILGAQFTENEGKRLIERAFNPKLQEPENIRRLKRLSKQMSDAARAKNEAVEYFQENGTLKGFKGKIYTQSMQFIEEFEAGLTLDKSDYEAEARKRGLIK